ncbi:MAG: aminotransferase class III-fold pyridoxal phosphate-dependent enzyme, partial [Candidatus Latescibacterota bacterium]
MGAYSNELIEAVLRAEYNLSGSGITRLAGENDNYLITTGEGLRVVLKFAGDGQDRNSFELEHAAIEQALQAGVGLNLPRFIPTRSGGIEAKYDTDGGDTLSARLIEFVGGTAWCDAEAADPKRLRALGRTIGRLALALAQVNHPAARRTHRWDLAQAGRHRNSIKLIDDPARRRMLEWFYHLYAACAAPRLKDLPHSLIHGDANDENILLSDGTISGLLDFGDCLYNPTVCDLAITLAYAMLDRPDPLRIGAEVVAGYHEVHSLSPDELTVLFPLICGRMSVTVAVAAERRQVDPNRSDWFVTEPRAWRLLEQLYSIDPDDATHALCQKIDRGHRHARGPSAAALLEKRKRRFSDALSIAYDEPLAIVRGSGQYLYDNRGRPLLDLVNNVCHVGHCHPRVVEAGQKQMAQLNTNTRYLYPGFTDYAERLCATLPGPLDTCFFVNSGTEANELALRLARIHTGRHDILVVAGAYHGHTTTLIDISPYKFMGQGGTGKAANWVHVVPIADGYRGIHKGHDASAGTAYAGEVESVIRETNRPIAAFIAESLLGCGGQVIPPQGYLESVFRYVRAAGGL